LGELPPRHNALGFFCWERSLKIHIETTRGVSHCGLELYIKMYLKAKEELRKLKYSTMQKTYTSKKSSQKKPKSFKTL
jgi:hypothetical protein